MPLAASPLEQADYSLGAFYGRAPYLIPNGGTARMQNMLLEDDGTAYGRRGSTLKSDADFGSSGSRGIWDGILAGGARTVWANTVDFATLAGNDSTPVNVGGAGLSRPFMPTVLDGILYWNTTLYGGSRKTAAYTTGTVTVTENSATVVGSGTSWVANVDAGMILALSGRAMAVKSVESNTSLTLEREWSVPTVSGASYSLSPVVATSAVTVLPSATPSAWCAVGNRMLMAVDNVVYMSNIFDGMVWTANELWNLPDGVSVTAIAKLGDVAMIFTTGGAYTLSGLPFDLTDDAGNVQQRLERVNDTLGLWDQAGIATWQERLLVPSTDGLWLMGQGSSTLVSRSISTRWRELVADGNRLGNATVHRGHYVVPVLSAGNEFVDMLVVRLDRPTSVSGFGDVYPWANWKGAAAEVAGVAVRTGATDREPVMLGATLDSSARVIQYAPFQPDGPETDHDDTAPDAFIVSRDYGPLRQSMVKKLFVWYELISSGTAEITAGYGLEASAPSVVFSESLIIGTFTFSGGSDDLGITSLSGGGPEGYGRTPFKWKIGKRAQYVRFKIQCSDAATRFVVRSIGASVRPSGRIQ